MKILVACEYSGRVREAFRAKGHEAWSCDLYEDAEDGSPFHMKADALQVAYYMLWDLMVCHPPCTHLAVSGSRHFAAKKADGRQDAALQFVNLLLNAPIERIALENPVSIISSRIRKPDQIIQPWQFGHGETKATCLWLKNLPSLSLLPMLWKEERPASTVCRPALIAGKNAVGHIRVLRTQWPRSGADA